MRSFKIKIRGILIPRLVFIAITGLYMAAVMISSSHPAPEVAGADKNIMKHVYNLAHLPAYSILTFLLLCSFDSFTPLAQGAAFWTSFTFGVFNEVLQSHVPGRYFQVSDMMTNGTGALLTLVIFKMREAYLVKREARKLSLKREA